MCTEILLIRKYHTYTMHCVSNIKSNN